MPPRFDPNKLAALRTAKGWSLDDLAQKSGVNETTLGRWERGANVPQARNVSVLAKTFGVTAEALHVEDAPKAPKAGMRRASRLDELRPFDRDDGLFRWKGEALPQLTARALNRVKTAYELYADAKRKFWLEGIVAREHGLPPEEAEALGTRSGVGARFLVVKRLKGDAELGVTVHGADPEITLALLDVPEARVTRLVVQVVVPPGEPRGKLVFRFFDSESLRPFALRVLAVVRRGG